jgi:hypothetical protein
MQLQPTVLLHSIHLPKSRILLQNSQKQILSVQPITTSDTSDFGCTDHTCQTDQPTRDYRRLHVANQRHVDISRHIAVSPLKLGRCRSRSPLAVSTLPSQSRPLPLELLCSSALQSAPLGAGAWVRARCGGQRRRRRRGAAARGNGGRWEGRWR